MRSTIRDLAAAYPNRQSQIADRQALTFPFSPFPFPCSPLHLLGSDISPSCVGRPWVRGCGGVSRVLGGYPVQSLSSVMVVPSPAIHRPTIHRMSRVSRWARAGSRTDVLRVPQPTTRGHRRRAGAEAQWCLACSCRPARNDVAATVDPVAADSGS